MLLELGAPSRVGGLTWRKNDINLLGRLREVHRRVVQPAFLHGNSSVGRTTVSKTVGREFESYFPC